MDESTQEAASDLENAAHPTKVIFLDIDGPMIPATMFLVDKMASWHRLFPATTVAVMNRLCADTGAKIVFNTTHNEAMKNVDDIEVALVKQGLDAAHLHPSDLKTAYPDERRGAAVKTWLAKHPEVTTWIALDDSRFTDEPNLIWVDPDAGLHVGHLNAALYKLGGKPCIILV